MPGTDQTVSNGGRQYDNGTVPKAINTWKTLVDTDLAGYNQVGSGALKRKISGECPPPSRAPTMLVNARPIGTQRRVLSLIRITPVFNPSAAPCENASANLKLHDQKERVPAETKGCLR